ncbi:MAG: hypothetical protein KU28_01680 [Sulfurovum sp. PC08-66]|nr:MAG: hypothetical protein KU28_01680 [Sulfurovum sp. PC08-66]KIM12647.1 MAG: hypothetical protein KU37_01785 [Sulfuricurvum sp. PC08-66]
MLTQTLASLLTAIAVILLYYNVPQSLQDLDNRLRDFMFEHRGAIPTTGKVIIADIDEKSLKELGQWPWGRKTIAQVIQNLHDAGAKVIGLDMVFAEPDKRSDAYIIQERQWSVTNIDEPEDYDVILGNVVGATHTVLGYTWNFAETTPHVTSDNYPFPKTTINYNSQIPDRIMEPLGLTPNLSKIQVARDTDESPSEGFFNNMSDSDGIIRRVPLLVKKEGYYYPSLALEMFARYHDVESADLLYFDGEFVGVKVASTEIPTDNAARFLVNFRGKAKTFEYLSASDIYNNRIDRAKIEGKLVLLGTSAIGLLDIRAMPMDTEYPGVEVHANIIDNMLAGDFLVITSSTQGQELLSIFAVIMLVGIIMALLPPAWAMASVFVISYAMFEYLYYFLFSQGTVLNILFPFVGIFLITVVSLLLSYIMEGKTKELIKAKFAQKVSPDVVEELLKDPDSVNFAAMDKEVTIFFSDVRSFTTISEKLGSAERLIQLMNDYMTPMVEIIMQERGTIDKFIGDAIMAYWNAPRDLKGHQDHAVRASLRQLKALDGLNKELVAKYGVDIHIGIGLNTGIAVVGEMGSRGRSDYTIIGDPVNLGSRLEGLCKPYGVTLIISEFTKAGLVDEYVIRELDLVRVKGKELPVAIYEVLDFGKPDERMASLLQRYDDGLHLYKEARFAEALEIFTALEAEDHRKIHALYIERCQHFIENPPVDFDGVFTFTTK